MSVNRQMGAVSTALVAVLVVIGVLGVIIAIGVGSYISAYNYGNQAEQHLVAVRDNNKNILAQYGQKVQEAAQVPAEYRDDLSKVLNTDVAGRYGPNGSQATMQWLKEHNVSLDGRLYEQIQQIIESGRTDFENGQKEQIDAKRAYETQLGSFWTGMWLRIAGYPKLNLADFVIVSTDRADKAFKDHKEDGPIQLRQ